jgi:hypothetical protein
MRVPRLTARRIASTAAASATLGAVGALALTPAAASAATHGAGPLIADAGPLAARLVDADANYAGVGYDGKGTLSLQTNALGNVSYYSAMWRKTVCGIRDFGLYYDAAESDGLPVDDAGIFVEQYAITYRSGGKRYTVQAIDSAQIGNFVGEDGVTRDMVFFRERVRVRRQKKGAKWCSGVHKKAFVGYRITSGA